MKLIRVYTQNWEFEFYGKYRRDLEKPNWHYYETKSGTIAHFQKNKMEGVVDGPGVNAKSRGGGKIA